MCSLGLLTTSHFQSRNVYQDRSSGTLAEACVHSSSLPACSVESVPLGRIIPYRVQFAYLICFVPVSCHFRLEVQHQDPHYAPHRLSANALQRFLSMWFGLKACLFWTHATWERYHGGLWVNIYSRRFKASRIARRSGNHRERRG